MAGLIGGGVLVPIGLRLTSIHQDHLKRKRGPFVSKPNCSPSCNAGRNKTFASFFDIRINHSLGASLKLASFRKTLRPNLRCTKQSAKAGPAKCALSSPREFGNIQLKNRPSERALNLASFRKTALQAS